MFIIIWGVDGFYVGNLMTLQRSFNYQYFVSYVMAPMVAKIGSRGEFYMSVDYNFTWITVESIFQRPLNNLSLKTILDVCLTHLTVLILHHHTSRFSVM
jgi:hypothetical protein